VKCGETIFVKDLNGSYVMRFVAQCGNRFMLIAHGMNPMNGYILTGWPDVLRELVALAVPQKLADKQVTAESHAGGGYASTRLAYPLSAAGLAALFGLPADEVRAQLDDLAVQVIP
jgi:hypothetical protein